MMLLSVFTKTREETPFHLGVKRRLMCQTLSTSVFRNHLKGSVSLLLCYQEVYMRPFILIQKLGGGKC